MSAVIVRLDDATLDRLSDLAKVYGVDESTIITRLLERDPHDHDHRCPTCARMSRHQHDEAVRLSDEATLFA